MEMNRQDQRLFFDGCDTVELAKKYGTPLYLVSLSSIYEKVKQLKSAFTDRYENTRIAYAAKAFLTKGMVRIIDELDLCLDVVSGGELDCALRAGFPPERIEFNGNNKLPWEIDLAVKSGVGRLIIDGFNELDGIIESAKKHHRTVPVLIRLTPGVSADSHDYIVTGKKDSKFGFPVDSPALYRTIEQAIESEYTDFLGFHFHIGSQLESNEVYLDSLDIVFELLKKLRKERGFVSKELNIGGGFGIRYTEEDDPKPFDYFFTPVMEKIDAFFKEEGMPRPEIVTEPGRSLIGEAGRTLYTVGSIKEIAGLRRYVMIDGGMNDNIRPALYQAKYHVVNASKYDQEPTELSTVSGKICESGDILAKDVLLAPTEPGDILAFYSTGAYGYSMASNYNKIPVPAVVLLYKGKDELMVKRQTLEELHRNDLIPEMISRL
ncbi:MAG TPA: diaminopimelate decarboxylase [Tissierellia bacterium]|nr:diaminopimelate decarboxylase [Tissierellia bacterium]